MRIILFSIYYKYFDRKALPHDQHTLASSFNSLYNRIRYCKLFIINGCPPNLQLREPNLY